MKFFRFFCYVCLVSLVFVGTGCAMAMQRMPAPIPPVVVVQETKNILWYVQS